MKYLLFILLSLCAIVCYATVYMKTDSSGNISYSDVSSDSAQPINVTIDNTVTAPDNTLPTAPPPTVVPGTASPVIVEQPVTNTYQTFTILSPKDQESIQNQPSFPVNLVIDPELQEGDSVQLFVDGTPWGAPQKQPTLTVNQLDRGTHQLNAKLLNANGVILKETQTIQIFVHRASTNFSRP